MEKLFVMPQGMCMRILIAHHAGYFNVCIDLRGRPGTDLSVRSLTRHVRDVPGVG